MKLTALLRLSSLAGAVSGAQAGAQPLVARDHEMASKGAAWMRQEHSEKVGRLLPTADGGKRARELQTTIPEAPPSALTVAVSSFEELKEVIASTSVATTVEVEQDIVFTAPVVIPADATVWIVGSGSSPKKMDGASTSQHFIVYGKAWVENLWFVNGFGTNGGSILVTDGGSLSARMSTFMNNTAFHSPAPDSLTPGAQQPPNLGPAPEIRPYPGAGDGGAIAAFNSSVVDILSCEFMGNIASRMGGAVVAEDSCRLSVSDSAFTMNECRVWEIDGQAFGGGAIAVID